MCRAGLTAGLCPVLGHLTGPFDRDLIFQPPLFKIRWLVQHVVRKSQVESTAERLQLL